MATILVVDDDARIVAQTEKFLQRLRYDVLTAFGGKEAIDILNSPQKVDLVIVDLKMPEIDGIQVMEAVVRKKIPLIPISGTVIFDKYQQDLERLGYSRTTVLPKPVDPYVLMDLVELRLKGR